jgi:hypothetical protein
MRYKYTPEQIAGMPPYIQFEMLSSDESSEIIEFQDQAEYLAWLMKRSN